MNTGDTVFYILVAKLACCVLIALAGAGLLGGFLGWLFGPGFWLVALAFLGAIGIVMWSLSPSGHHRDRSRRNAAGGSG